MNPDSFCSRGKTIAGGDYMPKRRRCSKMAPEKEANAENINMIQVDPLGSYTGRPLDKNEIPQQDADDL